MHSKLTLLLAGTGLLACVSDSSRHQSVMMDAGAGGPDLFMSVADLSSSSPRDPGVPLAQCGRIPVLGIQGTRTSDACLRCVDANCCVEATYCGSVPLCVAYRMCAAGCETANCNSNCRLAFGTQLPSDQFNICRDLKCSPVCNDLSCLGNVQWPRPPQTRYLMNIITSDFTTRDVIPNAQVKVCPPGDALCASPTAVGTTDSNGLVSLIVPMNETGLDGFLEVSESLHMTHLFFSHQTNNFGCAQCSVLGVLVVSKSDFDVFAAATGSSPDPSRGHLGFLARDCGSNLVAGVSVSVSSADAQSITAYSAGGIPSRTATQTDATAFGFIVNVPPGAATINSQIGPTPFGRVGVLFRGGTVTSLNVMPTP